MEPLDQLVAKSRAYVFQLSKMTDKERMQTPSQKFISDYNNMRTLVLQNFKEWQPYMPPSIASNDGVNLGEVLNFGQQINEMLVKECSQH